MSEEHIQKTNASIEANSNRKLFWKIMGVLFGGFGTAALFFWVGTCNPEESRTGDIISIKNIDTPETRTEFTPIDHTNLDSVLDNRTLVFTGNIYDLKTKIPLVDAIVRMDSIECLTDSLGYYSITITTNKSPTNRSSIAAFKSGYISDQISVLLNSSSHNNILLNKLQ